VNLTKSEVKWKL